MTVFDDRLKEVRACRLCEAHLPLGPRPVVWLAPEVRLLIIGQAPGTKVHESGIPWDDASGDRLRDWLGLSREQFYGDPRIGVLPMGLCYPGRMPKGGDAPPRPECAPLWHPRLLPLLPEIRLTLLVGSFAQGRYLRGRGKGSLTETVRAWREYGPDLLPTPHPSWRVTLWMKKNPWFVEEVVPAIRRRVAGILAD